MRVEAGFAGGIVTEVVLASASPRRRELLAALLDDFEVLPADVPEPLTGDPAKDAVRLAEAKANAVSPHRPTALVIGSDTVVNDGNASYGKPANEVEATEMWRRLRGRGHTVYTGVAVVGAAGAEVGLSATEIVLSDLGDEAVAAYVASGRPMDKAGAYAIQDVDVPTVAHYSGCYCCVVGLPLWRLKRMLERKGVECRQPSTVFARCADCPERDD